MRLGLAGGALAVILIVAVIVSYSTFFTVNQTQQALVVRLGKPVWVITDPGLNVKVPFVDSVIYIDKRILNVESTAQEITLSSQDNSSRAELVGERLVVDAFVRYRITDALKYYQTVGASGADGQLSILLNSALRRVLGAATPSRLALRLSTCAFAAPTCRPRTARRFTSACKPSGSARRPSSAPRAARRVRKFAPRPIAT
jgi:membrane protease subunit HflC